MRDSVIDNIQRLGLGGFSVAKELPFDESGTPLYLKNQKKIYIDRESVEIAPLVTTLNSIDVSTTTTIVRVYFTTDAKTVPANLNNLLTDLQGIKNTIDDAGANRRTVTVNTSYTGDLLLVELEYTTIKLT